jgi:hypothetical protein
MLFDKNARLSARVFGTVLNYPLYDADCCPAARELLAVGNVAGAIAEWRRLVCPRIFEPHGCAVYAG